jgi:peroxiredoxin
MAKPDVGDKAPPFELTDLEGTRRSLSDFAGHPLVLVFLRHLA